MWSGLHLGSLELSTQSVGHRNDQRDRTSFLWGKAGRVGAVQPGEEKAPGRPYCSLSVLNGGLKERLAQTFQQGVLQ